MLLKMSHNRYNLTEISIIRINPKVNMPLQTPVTVSITGERSLIQNNSQ